MTSDLQALLAAVVADPSDDVARLVYADCLEEHGDEARAAFIRLQIEAARLHATSRERADLDRRAEELLEANWVAWWAEVCAAIGFPAPVPTPRSPLARFTRFITQRPTGGPFARSGCWVNRVAAVPNAQVFGGFSGVWFRRGFPEDVPLSGPSPFLSNWARAAPLHTLTLHTAYHDWWHDGPHLAGACALALVSGDPTALARVLASPHLDNLNDLILPASGAAPCANDLELLIGSPRARQLKRLAASVWDDRSAERLASAANLARLESLRVSLLPEGGRDPDAASRRRTALVILARSPHLANLKELEILGALDPDGLATAVRQPTWTGLTTLAFDLSYGYNSLAPLAEPDGLPQLTDLTLRNIWLGEGEIDALVRSPLLKRLRHFTLVGAPRFSPSLARLAEALDVTRVETFFLSLRSEAPGPDVPSSLSKHYGDKLHLVRH
jgi:uncharacterized protein (TIGR02996 family)